MQALYRVTDCKGNIYSCAPTTWHMTDLPTPTQDGIPSCWPTTHPHCAALQSTLNKWWPERVLNEYSKVADDWGYFKVIPLCESAALFGRRQACFDPSKCDIIPLTREQFLAELAAF